MNILKDDEGYSLKKIIAISAFIALCYKFISSDKWTDIALLYFPLAVILLFFFRGAITLLRIWKGKE